MHLGSKIVVVALVQILLTILYPESTGKKWVMPIALSIQRPPRDFLELGCSRSGWTCKIAREPM